MKVYQSMDDQALILKGVLIILFAIILLLVGLPLVHGFLVFASLDNLAAIPTVKSFFYLFTTPVWAVVIMVFVFETYRRSFITFTIID